MVGAESMVIGKASEFLNTQEGNYTQTIVVTEGDAIVTNDGWTGGIYHNPNATDSAGSQAGISWSRWRYRFQRLCLRGV